VSESTENSTNVTDELSAFGADAMSSLKTLLELSGIPAEIEATENDDAVRLRIIPESEDDAALLNGVQGRTQQAYKLILNRIVGRRHEDRKYVGIDVAGNNEQRDDMLMSMAERLADTTHKNGVNIHLVGMNAADRRVVHMALADMPDLSTFSKNVGIARRLIISPKSQSRDD
jgi:spoIIIJ-associated protein